MGFSSDGCVSRELPFSLLETAALERYLEAEAREGRILVKVSEFDRSGSFSEASDVPRVSHFSVGTYDRRITRALEKTAEFEAFCGLWEDLGWEYRCRYGNLAIFYSEGEERPREPEEKERQYSDEGRWRVSAGEDRRLFLRALFGRLFLVACYELLLSGSYYLRGGRSLRWEELCLLGVMLFLLAFFQTTPCRCFWKRHRMAIRFLRKKGFVPEFFILEREFVLNRAAELGTGVFLLWMGIHSLGEGMTAMALVSLAVAGGLLAAARLWLAPRGLFERNSCLPFLWRFAELLPLFCILAAFMLYPGEGNYRFSRGASLEVEGVGSGLVSSWEKEAVLTPEELGLGESVSRLYAEQKNMACRREEIFYQLQDMRGLDFGSGEFFKQVRYVGTVHGELKRESCLNAYLRQKGLSLEDSEELSVEGEKRWFLLSGGHELVGASGVDVVICFLNPYDERSFHGDDERLLKALERLTSLTPAPAAK